MSQELYASLSDEIKGPYFITGMEKVTAGGASPFQAA
jgi:hypothetical protein